MKYVCEVCDREDDLTEDEAFNAGWDYPPFIGAWGVVSPRTCGDCGIEKTVWWALVCDKKKVEDLTEAQQSTLQRILLEVNPLAVE